METGCQGHQLCPVNVLELVQGKNYLMVYPHVKVLELPPGFPNLVLGTCGALSGMEKENCSSREFWETRGILAVVFWGSSKRNCHQKRGESILPTSQTLVFLGSGITQSPCRGE